MMLFARAAAYTLVACIFVRIHFMLVSVGQSSQSISGIVNTLSHVAFAFGLTPTWRDQLPRILTEHGVTLYLALVIVLQFYRLVPRVYGAIASLNYLTELGRIIVDNVTLFVASVGLFGAALVSGQLLANSALGFESGFIGAWSVVMFVGVRRLTYSVSMMVLGSYVIVVIASVTKAC